MRDAELQARPATADDVTGLVAIWQESAETLAKLDSRYRVAADGATRWQTAFRASLTDPDRYAVVLLRGDTAIGYLIGAVQANLPGLLPDQIGVVLELAVDSHGRGGGVGTQMFALLTDWFKARGLTEIELRVPTRNPIAQAFWRALGATALYDYLWLKLRD